MLPIVQNHTLPDHNNMLIDCILDIHRQYHGEFEFFQGVNKELHAFEDPGNHWLSVIDLEISA